MLTRRFVCHLLTFGVLAASASAQAGWAGRCGWLLTSKHIPASALPLDQSGWRGLDEPAPYAGMVTSQFQEVTVPWRLEGEWPEGLRGRMLRMGPYGYDSLSGQRKRSILDSAGGMIREYNLDPAHPEFRNRHLQTPAYLAEKAAGRFLYPSIDTLAPGEWNSLMRVQSAASVAVYPHPDRSTREYWVTDEWQKPVTLRAADLSTGSAVVLDPLNPKAIYLAHGKRDPRTGNLCFLAVKPGMRTLVYAVCLDAGGGVAWRSSEAALPALPGKPIPYFHDWALTENHVVLFLHPLGFARAGMLRSLAGIAPAMASLKFDSGSPSSIHMIPRDGSPARNIVTDSAAQVWHFLNAYEINGELILDIAGNEPGKSSAPPLEPSPLREVMTGHPLAPHDFEPSVLLLRYRVSLPDYRLRGAEVLADDANYEFPTIAPGLQGKPYRFAYAARTDDDTPWHTAVSKLDLDHHTKDVYHFPAHQFVGEPIFAPRAASGADRRATEGSTVGATADEDDGFVLVDVYDAEVKANHLAIFNARNLAQGPIARLWIPLHLPYAFHGIWIPPSK